MESTNVLDVMHHFINLPPSSTLDVAGQLSTRVTLEPSIALLIQMAAELKSHVQRAADILVMYSKAKDSEHLLMNATASTASPSSSPPDHLLLLRKVFSIFFML